VRAALGAEIVVQSDSLIGLRAAALYGSHSKSKERVLKRSDQKRFLPHGAAKWAELIRIPKARARSWSAAAGGGGRCLLSNRKRTFCIFVVPTTRSMRSPPVIRTDSSSPTQKKNNASDLLFFSSNQVGKNKKNYV
jgi:hypothetical protein